MEFETLLALEKDAEVPEEWIVDPNHRATRLMPFGLVNRSDRSRIQGAQVQLRCTQLAKSGLRKYVFGLFQGSPTTRLARVYMLEVGPPQTCRHKNEDGSWIEGPHVLSPSGTDGPFLELLDQPFEMLFRQFAMSIKLTVNTPPDDPFELRLR
jgi:hypothetical protein